MSNKSNGTAFEKEFAWLLSKHGFWVHCLQDNANGQPFDVIAARNGLTYVFDCKDCQGNVFRLNRIEENQDNAMRLWSETGNHPGLFAVRFGERIYLIPHKVLLILRERGTASLSEQAVLKMGETFSRWIENRKKVEIGLCR